MFYDSFMISAHLTSLAILFACHNFSHFQPIENEVK